MNPVLRRTFEDVKRLVVRVVPVPLVVLHVVKSRIRVAIVMGVLIVVRIYVDPVLLSVDVVRVVPERILGIGIAVIRFAIEQIASVAIVPAVVLVLPIVLEVGPIVGVIVPVVLIAVSRIVVRGRGISVPVVAESLPLEAVPVSVLIVLDSRAIVVVDLHRVIVRINLGHLLQKLLVFAPVLVQLRRRRHDGVGGHFAPIAGPEVANRSPATIFAQQFELILRHGALTRKSACYKNKNIL